MQSWLSTKVWAMYFLSLARLMTCIVHLIPTCCLTGKRIKSYDRSPSRILYTYRASLLCGLWDEREDRSSEWSHSHTHHIYAVSLGCDLSDVSENRSCNWSPYRTLGTCKAFLPCEPSGEGAETSCRRKPSCTRRICRVSPPCGPLVNVQVCDLAEALSTLATPIRLLPHVQPPVDLEDGAGAEGSAALAAFVLPLQRGPSDGQEVWSSDRSPSHTLCIYWAFPLCGLPGGYTEATWIRTPSHTRHTCRASPPCGLGDGCEEKNCALPHSMPL